MQDLWQRIEPLSPLVTGRALRIAARGGRHARKQRDTTTEIRIDRIEMLPPQEASGSGPLSVIAAQVRDAEPAPDEDQYEWMLVSSEGRPAAAQARRLVGYYETRWCIEEFFRGASYYSIPRFSSGAGAVLPQGAPVRRLAAQDPVQSEASQRPAVAVR